MTRICNILVVEDDHAVRLLLGDILDHRGYLFTLTSSGAEMQAALDADDFDVAIIDISLRGEDGLVLGETATKKGCEVILTTGDPGRLPHVQASGRRHMMKPFRIQALTDLVDEVLKDSGTLCAARGQGGACPLGAPS
ncbi:MAG TPA: response regulator [Stellaceae bacterium]|jgi:two-component system OmpR family response regulator|nr:response regulator [Stellaceae bacterium]